MPLIFLYVPLIAIISSYPIMISIYRRYPRPRPRHCLHRRVPPSAVHHRMHPCICDSTFAVPTGSTPSWERWHHPLKFAFAIAMRKHTPIAAPTFTVYDVRLLLVPSLSYRYWRVHVHCLHRNPLHNFVHESLCPIVWYHNIFKNHPFLAANFYPTHMIHLLKVNLTVVIASFFTSLRKHTHYFVIFCTVLFVLYLPIVPLTKTNSPIPQIISANRQISQLVLPPPGMDQCTTDTSLSIVFITLFT